MFKMKIVDLFDKMGVDEIWQRNHIVNDNEYWWHREDFERGEKMKKFGFYELKGKEWGHTIICEAENVYEAMEKAGMTEYIRPYDRFKTMYFGKIYEVKEISNDPKSVNAIYICHK